MKTTPWKSDHLSILDKDGKVVFRPPIGVKYATERDKIVYQMQAERAVKCTNACADLRNPEDVLAAAVGLVKWWNSLEEGFKHDDLCVRIMAIKAAL